MEEKEFEFGRDGVYRLVAVTDRQGNDRTADETFYKDRVGCVATGFYYDDYSVAGLYRLNMTFVRTPDGQYANRGLHTSVVLEVKDKPGGFDLVTAYSVYSFEKAQLNEIPVKENRNVIELFLSHEDNYLFSKGFYHDPDGKAYDLVADIHVGMIQDSVLVRPVANDEIYDCVCRYFPESYGIEFYNTLYGQQSYSVPMLIHNTGVNDLEVRFERFPFSWTIKPGESKHIMPYNPEGADKENEPEKTYSLEEVERELGLLDT